MRRILFCSFAICAIWLMLISAAVAQNDYSRPASPAAEGATVFPVVPPTEIQPPPVNQAFQQRVWDMQAVTDARVNVERLAAVMGRRPEQLPLDEHGRIVLQQQDDIATRVGAIRGLLDGRNQPLNLVADEQPMLYAMRLWALATAEERGGLAIEQYFQTVQEELAQQPRRDYRLPAHVEFLQQLDAAMTWDEYYRIYIEHIERAEGQARALGHNVPYYIPIRLRRQIRQIGRAALMVGFVLLLMRPARTC